MPLLLRYSRAEVHRAILMGLRNEAHGAPNQAGVEELADATTEILEQELPAHIGRAVDLLLNEIVAIWLTIDTDDPRGSRFLGSATIERKLAADISRRARQIAEAFRRRIRLPRGGSKARFLWTVEKSRAFAAKVRTLTPLWQCVKKIQRRNESDASWQNMVYESAEYAQHVRQAGLEAPRDLIGTSRKVPPLTSACRQAARLIGAEGYKDSYLRRKYKEARNA